MEPIMDWGIAVILWIQQLRPAWKRGIGKNCKKIEKECRKEGDAEKGPRLAVVERRPSPREKDGKLYSCLWFRVLVEKCNFLEIHRKL